MYRISQWKAVITNWLQVVASGKRPSKEGGVYNHDRTAESICYLRVNVQTQDLSESSNNVLSGCDENMFVFGLVFKWFVMLIWIWILLAE